MLYAIKAEVNTSELDMLQPEYRRFNSHGFEMNRLNRVFYICNKGVKIY
jgi:hypothetical protein